MKREIVENDARIKRRTKLGHDPRKNSHESKSKTVKRNNELET